MGSVKPFTPEKLVIPLLTADAGLLGTVYSALEELFGPRDFESGPIDFSFTTYYEPEMGPALIRTITCFERLVSPEELPAVKLACNGLESTFAVDGRRRINLDPGLISFKRFILATTKNNGHRIPLRDGIYGEVTLVYVAGAFRSLQWTYPDYRSPAYIEVLDEIREIYKRQLKRGDEAQRRS